VVEVTEAKPLGKPGLVLSRQIDAMPFGKLQQRTRLDRPFQMDVKLDLGKAETEAR
jgi:hypothetical protein